MGYKSMTTYEMVSFKLLKGIPRGKIFCRLENNRLVKGNKSSHKTRMGLKYNLFWRIKDRRIEND